MADAVVGPLVKSLISLLNREFDQIQGVGKDVNKLVSTLSAIQAVLEDAEDKQTNSKPITDWLLKLRDATYDAEDVLEAWSLEIQRRESLEFANVGCSYKVSHSLLSCLCFKSIIFHRKTAKRIKKILITFDEIAAQKTQFHLNTVDVRQTGSQLIQERETTSIITEPHIYGRDENKMKIIDLLLNHFVNHEKVSIFPIVGMGGLGKTTLAQSIYNDQSVQTHFEVKSWVCVSEPFDLKKILKTIIEPFDMKACEFESLENGQRGVQKILKGKRYLIVLDDVWNEKQDEWDRLRSFLGGGARGSAVVLTTRSQRVASITHTVQAYQLEVLSDDDCFSLFMNHALGDMGEEEHPNLIAIGKQIANKCKGVPLVAKSLGSCLRFKTDEKQWERVRDSEIWKLEDGGENKVLAALRISYNHLSSHMKQCFAYFSLFRKDEAIEKAKMIYLWMANGFIKPERRVEVEDLGEELLNELVRLSFFEISARDNCVDIKSCKMHDLLHDLASYVASNDCLLTSLDETKHVPTKIRHLFINSSESPPGLGRLLYFQPSVRTLFFACSIDFHRFQFPSALRVLDLSYLSVETLPPSVCDLKHLRYLDLSHNLLTSLPKSLPKLRNLQMLDLSHNIGITTFPLPICKLEHLRYLDVSFCERLASLPQSIHGLKNLRNLDLTGNGEIATLPDSLGNLEHLRYLNLSKCTRLASLPETISGLRNLQSLLLRECRKLKALPQNIKDMSSLRHLDTWWCDKLSKMPVRIGELKCLQTLTRFRVGSQSNGESGESVADISELQGLNQLKGTLAIRGLENVTNGEDAKQVNLRSKKYLTDLQLLWDTSRQVDNSKEVLEGILPLPPNLQLLLISGYRWKASFPEVFLQNLKALKTLAIWECDEMVSLPEGLLQNLTSLYKLDIVECKRLKSLGLTGIQGGLNPNTATSSSSSSQLKSSLRVLNIMVCPKLVLSEEDFQNLNGLITLWLEDLPQLTALPQGIQQLLMLQYLTIRKCQNLRTLPEWIKRLTYLRYLKITNCHEELHKRCQEDKGEDWHLISHISDVRIKQKEEEEEE